MDQLRKVKYEKCDIVSDLNRTNGNNSYPKWPISNKPAFEFCSTFLFIEHMLLLMFEINKNQCNIQKDIKVMVSEHSEYFIE